MKINHVHFLCIEGQKRVKNIYHVGLRKLYNIQTDRKMTCFINCCVIGCILKAKEMGDERYGKVICTCSLYIYDSIWGLFLGHRN